MDDRVVITGLGAVTPLGNTWQETWSGLKDGRSGVSRITHFDPTGLPTQIAAEVKGFDPYAALSVKQVNRMSRTSQLAVIAAREALADSGIDPDLEDIEAAVVVNSAVSGFAEIQEATEIYHSNGERRMSPRFVSSSLTNMAACEVAIDLNIHGSVNASAAACASGAYAVLEARRLLLASEADIVLAGGADAAITPVMFAGLDAMRVLSTNNESPTEASRPFDAGRDGFVGGEGAVILMMERLSHAKARGAYVYAEVLGGAQTSDAFNTVAPEPLGVYAGKAITRALDRAKVNPADIDMICAHGTSTKMNDATETKAIKEAFGEAASKVAVTAPKSMTGHLIGAAGSLGALLCAMSIREGVIPPLTNYTTPDPECDLNFIEPTSRVQRVRRAITNAFGFGGQNCVVVFGAV